MKFAIALSAALVAAPVAAAPAPAKAPVRAAMAIPGAKIAGSPTRAHEGFNTRANEFAGFASTAVIFGAAIAVATVVSVVAAGGNKSN